MKIKDVPAVLRVARLSGDSVIQQGKHGIGKSTSIQDFSVEDNLFLTELFLSNQEVGDLIGHPKTIEIDGEYIQIWSVPVWLHRMREASKQGKHCILHLDELNRVEDTAVLQAALQLILEGKIHEHELPVLDGQKTFIVGSVNPADDIYDVHELDPALLDRFLFIEIEPCLQSYLEHSKNKIHPKILQFLKEHEKFLWYYNDNAGATPRAWSKLSNYLNNPGYWMLSRSQQYDILKGKIGLSAASEFLLFLEKGQITTEEVLAFINKELSSVNSFEELSENVQEFLKDVEPIRVTEITQLVIKKSTAKNLNLTLGLLYGIRTEILVQVLKSLKTDNLELFNMIVTLDSELNNKNLFRRITDLL